MSVVDEIKARLDIVDVIGQYVTLQKAGRSYKAVCPFHTEKTPSFIVNPDRQTWHCFGACGTGGDIFAFIGRKENLDFAGALRLLADRAGVELEPRATQRRDQLQPLFEANEAAALYYHNLLLRGAPAALEYAGQRGLDRSAIDDFQLGFSPAGWDNLRNHLNGRGFKDPVLVAAGLLIEGDRGPYDRFRERLIFPIRDDRGRVVGLGGRVLPGPEAIDSGAKYLNTPQTPIFDKGGLLYALDRARDEIRRTGTAVIVEGYMDVIAAHQHGFRNVVASMGTSITERQAGLLQRLADRVVLAMDSDEAGNAAALRGIQVVATAAERARTSSSYQDAGAQHSTALDIRVLALPEGSDPDDLVRADPGAWTALIAAARPVVDHYWEVVKQRFNTSNPEEYARAVREILPIVAEVSDPNARARYLGRLARNRIELEDLQREMGALSSSKTPARRSAAGGARRPEMTAPGTAPGGRGRTSRAPGEEYCLAMLYRVPEVAPLADALSEDLFTLSENRELFARWRRGEPVEEGDPALWDHYQQLLQTRLLFSETSQAEKAFVNCVDRLEQGRMKSFKEASALALAEGEAGVRPGQVASVARARLEAGQLEEGNGDGPIENAATRLLEDMTAGQRFHRRLIEKARPDQESSVNPRTPNSEAR